MRCHGSRQNVLDYVIKACGGRTNCYFNPSKEDANWPFLGMPVKILVVNILS